MKNIFLTSQTPGTRCLLAFLATAPFLMSCQKDQSVEDSQLSPVILTQSAANTDNGVANLVTGTILREVWTYKSGNDVAQIPVNTTPSSTSQISSLEGPTNNGENYGDRLRGYILPPSNGDYVFRIAADDAGELWLSTDAQPANKVKIAHTLSWTNTREWTKFASQKSKSITLKANQKYYIEVLHKQGGGGTNYSVQWTLPNGTTESPVPGNRLSPYVENVDPDYASSAVIDLYGKKDVTISGKYISGGSAPLIKLTNCENIRITGNKLANSSNVGIYMYNCKNITIDNNFFTNVSTGVYADQSNGGGIVVNDNQFLNMQGPFPRGQFVQFNNVKGAGSSISNNKGENILGQSYPEDAISLYQSSGTPVSPVLVKNNWIRGGGPSNSGGGIMLGDQGGSYLYASDNILVDPGQFGMAISGGDHITIVNNSIYGKQQSFTNVGLYVNDIGGYKTSAAKVTSNKVKFYNSTNYQNNAWLSPNSAKPEGWDANQWGAAVDANLLPRVIITKK